MRSLNNSSVITDKINKSIRERFECVVGSQTMAICILLSSDVDIFCNFPIVILPQETVLYFVLLMISTVTIEQSVFSIHVVNFQRLMGNGPTEIQV